MTRIIIRQFASVQKRMVSATAMILACGVLASTAQAQVCGDADGNGSVTVTDGVQVLRAAAALESKCSGRTCDLDGNGEVSVTDGVVTLQRAAELASGVSCGTRFGALVKTVRVNGSLAELQLGPPPAATSGAPVDIVAIEGNAELGGDQPTDLVVRLQRPVDGLILGFQENGTAVDGFVELDTRFEAVANVELQAVDVSTSATAELRIATKVGGQVGGFRTKTLTVVPSAGSIACDQILTSEIENAIDTDRYNFTVVDGERVWIETFSRSPGGDPFRPAWRLLDRLGQVVPECLFSYETYDCVAPEWHSFGDCGPLPTTGNPYRIEVADCGKNNTGLYGLRLQHLSAVGVCEQTPIQVDTPVEARIDAQSDGDLFEFAFNVLDGEIVSIDVDPQLPADEGFDPIWRVLDAAGHPRCGRQGCNNGNGTNCDEQFQRGNVDCALPASGNPYRIEVLEGNLRRTGNYVVFVQR